MRIYNENYVFLVRRFCGSFIQANLFLEQIKYKNLFTEHEQEIF
jgi:hypothetical protein